MGTNSTIPTKGWTWDRPAYTFGHQHGCADVRLIFSLSVNAAPRSCSRRLLTKHLSTHDKLCRCNSTPTISKTRVSFSRREAVFKWKKEQRLTSSRKSLAERLPEKGRTGTLCEKNSQTALTSKIKSSRSRRTMVPQKRCVLISSSSKWKKKRCSASSLLLLCHKRIQEQYTSIPMAKGQQQIHRSKTLEFLRFKRTFNLKRDMQENRDARYCPSLFRLTRVQTLPRTDTTDLFVRLCLHRVSPFYQYWNCVGRTLRIGAL